MVLRPTAMVRRVYDLAPGQLREWGVEGLVLDVDNTLTYDNSQQLQAPGDRLAGDDAGGGVLPC